MKKPIAFWVLTLALIGSFMLMPGLMSNTLAQDSEPDSPTPAEKIEEGLRDRVQADGQGTYWVYLAKQADLSAAYGIADWNERGQYVYKTLLETAHESQAELIQYLETEMRNGNVKSFRSYFIVNAVLVTSNVAVLDAIAARAETSLLRATRTFPVPELIPAESPEAPQAIEWGVNRIGSPQIWSTYGTTGQGIIVANIDTGVAYTHAALVNQYRGNLGGGNFNHNYNWYDATNLCSGSAPCDQNNHGTHTMGTMVGYDGGSNQIGNAPGAKWIAARGCEANTCSDAALTASWEWMVAPCASGDDPGDPSCDPNQRPHVLNYSIGGPGGNASDQPLINAARAAGIVLSISAGNSGPGSNTVGSPGDYCNVIGVGATDINDVIASFSSRGPGNFNCGDPQMRKPDVSAPGVSVRSSIANGSYANFNGTSMAAPHVAGCAALLRGININTTHDDIFEALINTATDLGTAGFDFNYGYGRINCFSAAQYLFPPGTPVPTATPLPTVTPPPTATPPAGAVFFDNFETNQGWTTNPFGTDTATTGQWERGDPEGTDSSGPKQLGTTVSGVNDLVTGRLAGSGAGSYDIDGGITSIRSPNINLPIGQSLTLSFSYYLAHLNNASSADFLRVTVVGSTSSVVFQEVGGADDDDAVWASFSGSLNAFAGQTVYLLIEAADASGASLVEAAVDNVSITTGGPQPTPTPGLTTVFSDNFETNLGWTTNPSGNDTATTGQWERGDPETTTSSGTKQLGTTVSGVNDLVTGRLAGSGVGSYDIDGGTTSIRSPDIPLPSSGNITLSFSYYLAHLNNASSADFLRVTVVGSTSAVVFQEVGAADDDDAVWATFSANLNAFAGQTVYLLIEAADASGASLVEAAIDNVLITAQ